MQPDVPRPFPNPLFEQKVTLLARLVEFEAEWAIADQQALDSLNEQPLTVDEITAFDDQRARVSFLLPGVRKAFRYTNIKRVQMGVQEDLEVFGFLLEGIPHLGSFRDPLLGPGYKERYFELRTRARSLLQQAQGQLQAEIEDLKANPAPVDAVAELATGLGTTRFLHHLSTADRHLADGDYGDCAAACRRAVERLATELANRVANEDKSRRFNDAIGVLRDKGIIDVSVVKYLATPNVGLWGWLSTIGSHDEYDPTVETESVPAVDEAQLAIDATRAALSYILRRYADFQRNL